MSKGSRERKESAVLPPKLPEKQSSCVSSQSFACSDPDLARRRAEQRLWSERRALGRGCDGREREQGWCRCVCHAHARCRALRRRSTVGSAARSRRRNLVFCAAARAGDRPQARSGPGRSDARRNSTTLVALVALAALAGP